MIKIEDIESHIQSLVLKGPKSKCFSRSDFSLDFVVVNLFLPFLLSLPLFSFPFFSHHHPQVQHPKQIFLKDILHNFSFCNTHCKTLRV